MSKFKKTEKKIPGKKLARIIADLSPLRVLAQSFVFVYKGQKPNVALFVKSGKVENGKEDISIGPGESGVLLFFKELLDGLPAVADLKVMRGSTVSIIDKQTAEKIISFECLEGEKV